MTITVNQQARCLVRVAIIIALDPVPCSVGEVLEGDSIELIASGTANNIDISGRRIHRYRISVIGSQAWIIDVVPN